MFLHDDHLKKVGFFDEQLFVTFEEQDWCMRANSADFDLKMLKVAEVEHSGSGTMGGLCSPLSNYFPVRDELFCVELHGSFRARLGPIKNLLDWT